MLLFWLPDVMFLVISLNQFQNGNETGTILSVQVLCWMAVYFIFQTDGALPPGEIICLPTNAALLSLYSC